LREIIEKKKNLSSGRINVFIDWGESLGIEGIFFWRRRWNWRSSVFFTIITDYVNMLLTDRD
jgi:hypothetical protein